MAPTLAYWNIRGLAQPIRLLLAYTNTEYEQKDYACDGTGPVWMDEKFKLGLDFPNLPYYIDGDIKLTQSGAIMKHLARKHGLFGTTEKELTTLDMLENCIIDIRNSFTVLCYNPQFDELVADYKASAPAGFKRFDEYLGDKKFLLGDKITYVDFMLYEVIDQHKIFDKNVVEPCKKLMEYHARIEALPGIAKYKKSDKFIERPINAPSAKFR